MTFWSRKDQNWTPNWTPFCDLIMREIEGHFKRIKAPKKSTCKIPKNWIRKIDYKQRIVIRFQITQTNIQTNE